MTFLGHRRLNAADAVVQREGKEYAADERHVNGVEKSFRSSGPLVGRLRFSRQLKCPKNHDIYQP